MYTIVGSACRTNISSSVCSRLTFEFFCNFRSTGEICACTAHMVRTKLASVVIQAENQSIRYLIMHCSYFVPSSDSGFEPHISTEIVLQYQKVSDVLDIWSDSIGLTAVWFEQWTPVDHVHICRFVFGMSCCCWLEWLSVEQPYCLPYQSRLHVHLKHILKILHLIQYYFLYFHLALSKCYESTFHYYIAHLLPNRSIHIQKHLVMRSNSLSFRK